MDPDGAAASQYDRITKSFGQTAFSPEAVAYANYLLGEVRRGLVIALVLDLHNVESAESAFELFIPYTSVDKELIPSLASVNGLVTRAFEGCGLRSRPDVPVDTNYPMFRLVGWVERITDCLLTLYEMDSQNSHRHLSLAQSRLVGRCLVAAAAAFTETPNGKQVIERSARRSAFVRSIDTIRQFDPARGDNALIATVPLGL